MGALCALRHPRRRKCSRSFENPQGCTTKPTSARLCQIASHLQGHHRQLSKERLATAGPLTHGCEGGTWQERPHWGVEEQGYIRSGVSLHYFISRATRIQLSANVLRQWTAPLCTMRTKARSRPLNWPMQRSGRSGLQQQPDPRRGDRPMQPVQTSQACKPSRSRSRCRACR